MTPEQRIAARRLANAIDRRVWMAYSEAAALLRELAASVEPAPGYCKHCKQYTIEEPLPAEPVQEPDAECIDDICAEHSGRIEAFAYLPTGTKLYAHPPQREPVQEPVAWHFEVQEPLAWYFEAKHIDSAWHATVSMTHPGAEGVYMRKVTPLYAHPPQREPLTDEQITAIKDVSLDPVQYGGHEGMTPERVFDVAKFARAIERAHGIGEAR